MPVILQHLHSTAELDSGDLKDLELLRADHPQPGPDPAQRFDTGQWLAAGRFNGHILAAAWLVDADRCWRIEDLAVRAMTRRRGVARQLLTLLIRDARQAGRGLSVTVQRAELLSPLLLELGFARVEAPAAPPLWICPPP